MKITTTLIISKLYRMIRWGGDPASLSLVALGSNGACVAQWGTINELIMTIAILLISFAASLQERDPCFIACCPSISEENIAFLTCTHIEATLGGGRALKNNLLPFSQWYLRGTKIYLSLSEFKSWLYLLPTLWPSKSYRVIKNSLTWIFLAALEKQRGGKGSVTTYQ